MSETRPTLAQIMDSYLNTGYYDDEFRGWVGVERNADGWTVSFTDEDEVTTRYELRAVSS